MPLLKALVAQLLGIAGMLLLHSGLYPAIKLEMWALLVVQGIVAAFFSRLLRQPAWWWGIHLVFLPAASMLMMQAIPAWLYLLLVSVLMLVYWGTFKGDVPLYVSSSAVMKLVESIALIEKAQQFAELGAGVGSVAIPLAKCLPGLTVMAYELAPLPWTILAWRGLALSNIKVVRNSFWDSNLNGFDVVFAFLSPAVMERLAMKAKQEMRSGSLLISSSFPIPGWHAERIHRLNDARSTKLFCYRIN